MKRSYIILGGLLIVVLIIWKNYIPKSCIVGKYVNNNTEPILDGPNSIQNGRDTLILFGDNKFISKTWGNGIYEIESSFGQTEINLSYSYELGKAGFSTQISKSFLGNLRIWLNYDLRYYFEKIE